jgi:hypothetical protein
MKLKSTTWILVLVAVILGGAVYFTQVHNPPQTQATSQSQSLFDFQENQVKSLTVKTQLRSLAFTKTDQGVWQMQEPDKTTADPAAIAYLLNLIATGKSDRTITASPGQQADFGLNQPMAVIDLTLDNQKTHRLIVGGYNYNRSALYAQADPATDAQELKVVLVSSEFDMAVNRALADWKAKPKADKPRDSSGQASPAVSPSPSAIPSPSATPGQAASPSSAATPNSAASPSPVPSPTATASPPATPNPSP